MVVGDDYFEIAAFLKKIFLNFQKNKNIRFNNE